MFLYVCVSCDDSGETEEETSDASCYVETATSEKRGKKRKQRDEESPSPSIVFCASFGLRSDSRVQNDKSGDRTCSKGKREATKVVKCHTIY